MIAGISSLAAAVWLARIQQERMQRGSANSCREGLDEELSWDQYKKLHWGDRWVTADIDHGTSGASPLPNSLYNRNGIMFWNQYAVMLRDEIEDKIVEGLQEAMWDFYGGDYFPGNPGSAWSWNQIDAPILTPDELVSTQYRRERMYGTRDDLVLRPQTTPGSFQYASTKMKALGRLERDFWFPFVVWQHGKSFRREQTKTRKHQRLKEFYQLEIQLFDVPCRFTNKAEVMKLIQAVKKSIQSFVGRCKVIDAKAPSYAEWTQDIILSKTGMELASISLRKDFPARHGAGKVSAGKEIVVLEFAIGTDRVLMNTKQTVMRRIVEGKWAKNKSHEEERKRRRKKDRDASK